MSRFSVDDVAHFMGSLKPADLTKRYAFTLDALDAASATQALTSIGAATEGDLRILLGQLHDPAFQNDLKQRADAIHPHITQSLPAQAIAAIVFNTVSFTGGLPDRCPVPIDIEQHILESAKTSS